jgi:hypothetical protein
MALWALPARLWTVARTFEDVLTTQQATKAALQAIEVRLRALEDRMTHLEAGQGQIIAEARAAAGAAATGLAGSVISDVVTRPTRLEIQQGGARPRIAPQE